MVRNRSHWLWQNCMTSAEWNDIYIQKSQAKSILPAIQEKTDTLGYKKAIMKSGYLDGSDIQGWIKTIFGPRRWFWNFWQKPFHWNTKMMVWWYYISLHMCKNRREGNHYLNDLCTDIYGSVLAFFSSYRQKIDLVMVMSFFKMIMHLDTAKY